MFNSFASHDLDQTNTSKKWLSSGSLLSLLYSTSRCVLVLSPHILVNTHRLGECLITQQLLNNCRGQSSVSPTIQFSSLLSPSFIAFHIECAYRPTSMGDSNCFQPFFSCREPGLLFGVGQKGRAVWEPRIFTWSMLHKKR